MRKKHTSTGSCAGFDPDKMDVIFYKTYDSYRFGSLRDLKAQHIRKLVSIFASPPQRTGVTLEGRIPPSNVSLEGIGDVVVKHYRRGGFPGLFLKCTYLKVGKTRCQIEYEQLKNADLLGINVPEPVAFVSKGKAFYQGWLITREIKHQQSLAKLGRLDVSRAQAAKRKLIEQINLLIDNHIHHTDLHPGNVLVTDEARVYLIDFDKAYRYSGSRKKLQKKYIERWNRAVTKHRLPDILYLSGRELTCPS